MRKYPLDTDVAASYYRAIEWPQSGPKKCPYCKSPLALRKTIRGDGSVYFVRMCCYGDDPSPLEGELELMNDMEMTFSWDERDG